MCTNMYACGRCVCKGMCACECMSLCACKHVGEANMHMRVCVCVPTALWVSALFYPPIAPLEEVTLDTSHSIH